MEKTDSETLQYCTNRQNRAARLLDWQDQVGSETDTGLPRKVKMHHEWMIKSRISIRVRFDIHGAQSQMIAPKIMKKCFPTQQC